MTKTSRINSGLRSHGVKRAEPEGLGCFTYVSRALQNNLAKIYNARNNIYVDYFKLKLRTCAQSMALGARTKFQLESLIRRTILVIYKFRENILESSRNVSEPPPGASHQRHQICLPIYGDVVLIRNGAFSYCGIQKQADGILKCISRMKLIDLLHFHPHIRGFVSKDPVAWCRTDNKAGLISLTAQFLQTMTFKALTYSTIVYSTLTKVMARCRQGTTGPRRILPAYLLEQCNWFSYDKDIFPRACKHLSQWGHCLPRSVRMAHPLVLFRLFGTARFTHNLQGYLTYI